MLTLSLSSTIISMSRTLERVLMLIAQGDIRISAHAYDELAADDILIRDVMVSVEGAVTV